MQTLRNGVLLFVSCIFVCQPLYSQSTPPPRGPGTTNRLSINPEGIGGNADSGRALISSNGRIVVFESDASNLIPSDTNGKKDIFLRNQKTGQISRISQGRGQIQPNGDSYQASVSPESPNGFVAVAYTSEASNLTFPPDGNGVSDIFLSLPVLDFTMRVSDRFDLAGQSNGDSSSPSVTIIPAPDRVVIAFASDASNLADSDGNGMRDIFVTSIVRPGPDPSFNPREASTTTRISVAPGGGDANGPSDHPRISGDGRFVVFESQATNLISGQTTSGTQIFLYDIKNQTTTLISKSSAGVFGNGNSFAPVINFPGNVIAYKTEASNIIEDGQTVPTGAPQFVLYDSVLGTSRRVNSTTSGGPSNGSDNENLTPELSPSGRLVLFADNGTNLSSTANNGLSNVYVMDSATGELFLISKGIGDTATDGDSFFPSFGQAGFNSTTALVVFQSEATNLIPNDPEGNADDFITDYMIPPRPIQAGVRLDVPPDVTINGKKLKLTFEEFSGVGALTRSGRRISKRASGKIKYRVTIQKVSDTDTSSQVIGSSETAAAKKSDIIRKTTKKTSVTTSKLSSGTYTTSYRTTSSSRSRLISGKSTFKSDPSPSQRVTID